MIPGRLGGFLFGMIVAAVWSPGLARAQGVVVPEGPYRLNPYFAAPGSYGMMLGSPSYGSVRTYSEFSSSYGAGYGYGYAPGAFLPGRYGVGLWRPGFVAPGYAYGASYGSYRTFAVGNPAAPPPPVGVYAPAFGPSPYSGW